MDLSYTEEQVALRETATRFLKDRYSFDVRRRIDASTDGFNPGIWRAFADLGWLALPFSSEDGGLDCGMVDVALLAEALGASLVAEPYVSTVVVCGRLIAATGSAEQRRRLISEIVAGRMILALAHNESDGRHAYGRVSARAARSGDGWRLHGQKAIALDGPLSDQFLVTARMEEDDGPLGLFLVPKGTAGMVAIPFPIVDGRRAANLVLGAVWVPADARLGDAPDQAMAIENATDSAVIALAADTIGAMQVLLDKTIAYTKTRIQFGQPLAANQVLKHRMVDMIVRIEEARSITLKAAIHSDDGSAPLIRGRAASAAKVKVSAASRFVAEQAVQLHGAMGVTDELDVGSYFKRIMAFEASYGTPAWHLKRYGSLQAANDARAS